MSLITVYDKHTNKVTPEGWRYLVREMLYNWDRTAPRRLWIENQKKAMQAQHEANAAAGLYDTEEGDTDEPRGPTATDPE